MSDNEKDNNDKNNKKRRRKRFVFNKRKTDLHDDFDPNPNSDTDDDNKDIGDFVDILWGKYKHETVEELEEKFRPAKIRYVHLDVKAENIDDIIKISEQYKTKDDEKYNIDLKTINNIEKSLRKLNAMIGMKKLKQTIADQIIYFLQDFEKKNTHMMHTVIEGSPGSGKTEIANIMAEMYSQMGFLKHNTVKKVKRSDLIGEYLGHTAKKTQRVIDDAQHGILLIDEAYSLGNAEKRDSFSKECIDTLNQNLSEEKNNFICIIAGYRDSLRDCFFAYNPGLERRFPFRYVMDEYSADDLFNIFKKQIGDCDWQINTRNDELLNFFEKNRDAFEHNGGDLENLLQMSKISHSKRIFGKDEKLRKKITLEDVQNGFNIFKMNENIKDRIEKTNKLSLNSMYN
jgi:hypothetical protein